MEFPLESEPVFQNPEKQPVRRSLKSWHEQEYIREGNAKGVDSALGTHGRVLFAVG